MALCLLTRSPSYTPLFSDAKALFESLCTDEDFPYQKDVVNSILRAFDRHPVSSVCLPTLDLLDLPVSVSEQRRDNQSASPDEESIFKNMKVKTKVFVTPQAKAGYGKCGTGNKTTMSKGISAFDPDDFGGQGEKDRWNQLDRAFAVMPKKIAAENDAFDFVNAHYYG